MKGTAALEALGSAVWPANHCAAEEAFVVLMMVIMMDVPEG